MRYIGRGRGHAVHLHLGEARRVAPQYQPLIQHPVAVAGQHQDVLAVHHFPHPHVGDGRYLLVGAGIGLVRPRTPADVGADATLVRR